MTTHAQARLLAKESILKRFATTSLGEERHLAGVGCIETSYGAGWKGAGKGSNNMGAIQAGSSWTGPTFEYTDTHPNPDGTSTPYRIAFRKYATPIEGWLDLVNVAYVNRHREGVRAAAQRNDTLGVSKELHRTGYYEGFGATVEDRIRNHHRALSRAIAAADGAVVAPEPAPLITIPPTVRRGSGYQNTFVREAVRQLQRELRLVADGLFGPVTEATVRAYQKKNGLKQDGVVGPRTWTFLLTDDYIPAAA